MNAKFDAPWSSLAKFITAAIFALAVVIAIPTPLAGGPFVLILMVFGLLLWVREYRVTDDKIIIAMPLWKKSYDLRRLTRIEAQPFGTSGSIRVIGSGGFFGFLGLFRSPAIGSFTAFVTDPSNGVLLQFDEGCIVLSPGDPLKFVTTVEDAYSRLKHKSR